MTSRYRRGAALLAAVATLVGTLFVTGTASAAAAPAADRPSQSAYYLSLGDSIPFGYRPDLVSAGDFNPADYVGYPEDYARMRPHLTLVNYGCPGETTTTFIAGGCPWLLAGGPLHDSFGGASSQLTAALSFLAAHPGQVSLISLDIGSNDLLAVLAACGTNQTCIAARVGSPTQAGTLLGNYAQILAALRQAAPNAQLVVFNFYNPEAIAVPGSDALLAPINAAIRQLAGAFDASVADAFRVINHRAGSPAEDTFVCHRTWMCTAYAAIHPNQLGYHQLAIALVHATRR